ncbi:MAG: magnesium transporter CorA family protein, partial [Hyphomicrobiaceae bacterium]
AGKLVPRGDASVLGENGAKPIWVDLVFPTKDEDVAVEQALGISIPTRAEMREIEVSNRLYYENGAYYMTALVGYSIDSGSPEFATITFVLAGNTLVTVRYSEPKSFPLYIARTERGDAACGTAVAILIGLVETLIQRKADLIEQLQDDVNRIGGVIFDTKGGQQTRAKRLDVALRSIGRLGETASRAEESASSIDRMLLYLGQALRTRGDDVREIELAKVVQRDVRALIEQLEHLTERVTFLLQATLGMISIEQNQIIKLFSVMAVMLMPPTLVASIYGMNFKHMPELEWTLGYPLALIAMVLAAVVPYVHFKRRGWL